MEFKNFLYTKRKLIVLWIIFHSIALFVNLFEIEGTISVEKYSYITVGHNQTIFNLFTSHYVYYDEPINSYSSTIGGGTSEFTYSCFWPFVRFTENGKLNSFKGNSFYGIFIFYDYSEFIVYLLLLLIILYFRWEKLTAKQSVKNK